MPVRVLFVVSNLDRSGPVNIIYSIVKYLDRSSIEPVVLSLSPETGNSRAGDFEALSVPVYHLKISRWRWLLSFRKVFQDVILSIGPYVVHTHSLRADVSAAKHLAAYMRMSTVHGDLYANYKNEYHPLVAKLFESRQIRAVACMDLAVACSKSVQSCYKAELPDMRCIQNGVDTADFFPVQDKSTLRKKLSLPDDALVFVSAGSLIGRKDPATLIEGFRRRKHTGKALLVILGTGVLERSLKTAYSSADDVHFVGFVSNVNDYMRASDFFLSASLSEGLPNTVLEALACGLPVGLSDIPSHREILDIDELAGNLFTCGDADGLSRVVDGLLQADYPRLQRAASGVVQNNLNAKNMAAQYQSLYLSLIQHTHG